MNEEERLEVQGFICRRILNASDVVTQPDVLEILETLRSVISDTGDAFRNAGIPETDIPQMLIGFAVSAVFDYGRS